MNNPFPMLGTTKDILYIVISFCVLWFTVFICWMIYYLAMILRDVKKISHDIRRKFELVDMILSAVKEKIEDTSGLLHLIVEALSNLSGYFKVRKEKKNNKKK